MQHRFQFLVLCCVDELGVDNIESKFLKQNILRNFYLNYDPFSILSSLRRDLQRSHVDRFQDFF
jgi:hypothetical protein